MDLLPDFSQLDGKTFTATSGNLATVTVLGPGGVSVFWSGWDTDKDRDEFERWALTQVGAVPDRTAITRTNVGGCSTRVTPAELALYREFRKENDKDA